MLSTLRPALPIAAPVMVGYFTVGATFGLTATQAGFGWLWPVVISLIQFAGAAQYGQREQAGERPVARFESC